MKYLLLLSIFNFAFAHTHSDIIMVDTTAHNFATDYEAFDYDLQNRGQLFNKMNKETFSIYSSENNFNKLITIDFLTDELKKISGDKDIIINNSRVNIPERYSEKNKSLTSTYLYKRYEQYGFRAKPQTNSKYKNVIVEKLGSLDPNKVLIISSHYDSVGNAGANDDGTGTIAALSIAKALQNIDLNYTLRIIHFDAEESGLLGSKDYVKSLSSTELKKIIGNIQLEMMGTNSKKDGVFHVVDCAKRRSGHMNKFITDHIELSISQNNLEIINNPGCTTRSDHSAFWNKKIPAVAISENFFGGDGDRCYHAACDVVDSRIDYKYMQSITNAIYTSVLRILNN